MSVERVVGVDFGTSSSVIKIKTYKNGAPVGETVGADYIRFNNRDFVPTLVYEARDGSFLFGFEAESASVPGQLRSNFKLDLINEDEKIRSAANSCAKMFYGYLFKIYCEQSPRLPACDVETTIISYPAKWPASVREKMIELAQSAGFKNVTGLDEPTAAVKAVMVHDSKSVRLNGDGFANILVVDMGAGTTDLVLCKYSPQTGVSILNVWPKNNKGALLGGREVDIAVCEYVKQYLVNCGLPGSRDFRDKYLEKCKVWKETNVSPVLQKPDGVVRYCGFAESIVAMLGVDAEFPPLSRKEFESILDGYFAQLPQMVNDCLDDTGYNSKDIDCVILTGGHSQWYFAEEIITGKITKFGRVNLSKIEEDRSRVVKTPNPQETVALGLAYQKLSGKAPEAAQTAAPGPAYQRSSENVPGPAQTGGNIIFCTKCGTKNSELSACCARCGASLSEPLYPAAASVYAAPQTLVNNGKSEIFTLPCGKTVQGIANAVSTMLGYKNMNVQIIDSNDGGFIIQARDKGGKWKQFIGMDIALNVVIKQTGANTASLDFTQAKWIDKGGAMAVSMFVLWPLAVTSGVGMYMQAKLPNEIKNAAAVYVNS